MNTRRYAEHLMNTRRYAEHIKEQEENNNTANQFNIPPNNLQALASFLQITYKR
jgi:hypothetical protein